jgi:hypothetical protein
MRVAGKEERPRVAALHAIPADRLGDGEDVGLVEGATERGAAVTGRPERYALGWVCRVGRPVVVRGQQRIDIDKRGWIDRLAGFLADGHRGSLGTARTRGATVPRGSAAVAE